jgi:hypothetical protein
MILEFKITPRVTIFNIQLKILAMILDLDWQFHNEIILSTKGLKGGIFHMYNSEFKGWILLTANQAFRTSR